MADIVVLLPEFWIAGPSVDAADVLIVEDAGSRMPGRRRFSR